MRRSKSFSETEIVRLKNEAPDEGLAGVSPRFVINAISNAITRGNARSLTSMRELLLALKDAIDSDARIDAKQKKQWFDHLVTARKEFYNRWVKEDVHRALFASAFEDEGQQLLEKYLDEIEASLDQRQVTDPMTGENRALPDASGFCAPIERRSKVSESGKQSASVRKWCARPWSHSKPAKSFASAAMRGCAKRSSSISLKNAAMCCGW